METFASNVIWLVALPTLVVTGFLYAVHASIRASAGERPLGALPAALVAIAVGGYFLGHPHYPAAVPLIRAPTEWLFAVGGVFVTLGAVSLAYSKDRRLSDPGAWLLAILCVPAGFLVANRFEFGALVRLAGANDLGAAAFVTLPLALMFRLGHGRYDDRRRTIRFLLLVVASYALVSVNAIPLTERIRGPVGIVFVAYGCIGVLLGVPLYVLGVSLGSSSHER